MTLPDNEMVVFPWSDNFKTHIPLIDEQHKKLIDLVNKLTHTLVEYEASKCACVFEELSQYAEYHFKTEEAIWESYLQEDEWLAAHKASHDSFLPTIYELGNKNDTMPAAKTIEEIVKFLIRWLAFHIIDNDKRMVLTINHLKSGASPEQAKTRAEEEMSGAVQTLIDTILSMYESISAKALELLRERAMRIQAEQELHVINRKLQTLAITDQLTGLFNRRQFEALFQQELNRAKRSRRPLTYLMFDIDYFKKLNDCYGHIAGDTTLKAISIELKRLCRRPGDFVFRLGGEEFGILIADQTSQNGLAFAETLRAAIEALSIPNAQSTIADHLTISVGAISRVPGLKDTIDDYLKQADERLYQAKEQGRNRVVA